MPSPSPFPGSPASRATRLDCRWHWVHDVPVRFFDGGQELLLPRGLNWSQDQDLEDWGRQIWQGQRRPLGTPPADSIGLYCASRPRQRIFPYEVSILHDLCPMVVPWAFPDGTRDDFGKFLTETLPASDLVLSDSHSTKADAAWFSPLDPERIVVAYAGAEPLRGVPSPSRAGRAVGSDRPGGLDDRAAEERRLPVRLVPEDDAAAARHGAVVGGEARLDDLARRSSSGWRIPPGGGGSGSSTACPTPSFAACTRQASWSIYPSRYEGFGFPILDSLRHGTPVLASGTSSMAEFDHPGVFFFDPQDPATVDLAWRRLRGGQAGHDPAGWAGRALQLGPRGPDPAGRPCAERRSGRCRPASVLRAGVERRRSGQAQGGPLAPAVHGAGAGGGRARRGRRPGCGSGSRCSGPSPRSRNRGIGRYTRNLVAALLARDPDNDYVLYGHEGLPTDHIPTAPNAVTRLLRPDPARGETTLAHVMERLAETNPDGLDVLLLAQPPGNGPGLRPPRQTLERAEDGRGCL